MPVEFSEKSYKYVIYELQKGFDFQTQVTANHVKKIVHQCAEECHIDSLEIENFVAVACSHIYYDVMETTKKAVRMAIAQLMLELESERAKITVDSPENVDTSDRE